MTDKNMLLSKNSRIHNRIRTWGGLVFFLLTILTVLSACSTAQDGTQTGTTLPSSSTPTADQEIHFVRMMDATTGWALGPNSTLLHTKDAAFSWHEVTPRGLPAYLDNAQFPDASSAWLEAVTLNKDNSFQVFIQRTHDAGETWQTTESAPVTGEAFSSTHVATITFVDSNNGWIMFGLGGAEGSEGVVIFRTTDGGKAWQKVESTNPPNDTSASALPLSGNKNGISFATPLRGWATGVTPTENGAWLYKTEDGGKSWQQQKLALGKYSAPTGLNIQPPTFYSASVGTLHVEGLIDLAKPNVSLSIIYKTNDGGKTWNITTPVASTGGSEYSYDGVNSWLLDTVGNTFSHTGDAGAHWDTFSFTIQDNGAHHLFKSVSFVSPTIGWAVDKLGESNTSPRALVATIDGGKTWKQVKYGIV